MDWKNEPNILRLQYVLVGVGMVCLVGGAMQMSQASKGDELVTQETTDETGGEKAEKAVFFVVDIAGAVIRPGVYRLDEGKRVAEVIEKAGGFASTYDAGWVDQFLNQAEKVKDGQKIYIPFLEEGEVAGTTTKARSEIKEHKVQNKEVVNLNKADEKTLQELWGVGEARAQSIISNRPYGSLEEVETKAGIPKSIMEKNEGKMSVF